MLEIWYLSLEMFYTQTNMPKRLKSLKKDGLKITIYDEKN